MSEVYVNQSIVFCIDFKWNIANLSHHIIYQISQVYYEDVIMYSILTSCTQSTTKNMLTLCNSMQYNGQWKRQS